MSLWSSIKGANKCCSSLHPKTFIFLWFACDWYDIVGGVAGGRECASSLFGFVKGQLTSMMMIGRFSLNRFKVDDWHFAFNHSWGWLLNLRTFEVDSHSFRIETINEAAISWSCIIEIFFEMLFEVELEVEGIDRDFHLSSVDLEDGCEETLREEKCWNPIHSRFLEDGLSEKFNPRYEIYKPWGERLHRGIGFFLP